MDEKNDPQLPPALNDALRQRFRRDIAVPAALDAAILADARATISRATRRGRRLRWAGIGAALAAAAAIVVALRLGHVVPSATEAPQIAIANDLDGNGRVDILDALFLAKRLNQSAPPVAFDVNRDGRVDQSDVDALARESVSIGGRS